MKIGVILPFYNREKYLKEAIDSVLLQEGLYKIYAVDDGSTDGSLNIVQQYKTNKISIKVLKENTGVAFARNLGVISAALEGCDYIFNMGSDDILPKDALIIMASELKKNPKAAFFTPAYQIIGTNIAYYPPQGRTYQQQLQNNGLVGATMYRTKGWIKLGGYDEETYLPFGKATWEDYDLTTRALQAGYEYATLNKILYRYRKHEGSASNDIKRRNVKLQLREAFNNKFRHGGKVQISGVH